MYSTKEKLQPEARVVSLNRDAAACRDVFVGRQPIYDRQRRVYGYELLFRSGTENHAGQVDGELATSHVILTAFTDIGIDQVVDQHRAFVNLTHDFLVNDDPLPLPKERVVLEVLEDVAVDRELVDALARLSREGFIIALDDFIYHERWIPLLGIADIVKIDLPALDAAQIRDHVQRLRPFGVKLLAEKVETHEQFSTLHGLGFDYFQGYFLSRPEILSGRRPPSNRLAVLRLLARLHSPRVDFKELEEIVGQDVSLSYRLLRTVNSAFFGLPRKVKSVHQALVYVGFRALRRWASLVTVANQSDKPVELTRIALVRARMCERLAQARGRSDVEAYFTTGLLSALAPLMDMTPERALAELPLADEVQAAILAQEGPLGAALACTLAYERCDWGAVRLSGLTEGQIRGAYIDAVAWSFVVSKGMAA